MFGRGKKEKKAKKNKNAGLATKPLEEDELMVAEPDDYYAETDTPTPKAKAKKPSILAKVTKSTKASKPAKTADKPAKTAKLTKVSKPAKTASKPVAPNAVAPKAVAPKAVAPKVTAAKPTASANELKGVFIYSETETGYNFRLKASNRETLAVSETPYATVSTVKTGIESCRKWSRSPVLDLTKKNPPKMSNPKFELYKDKAGLFRYRLIANNGNLIFISEKGYTTKESCQKGIISVAKFAVDAPVKSEKEDKLR